MIQTWRDIQAAEAEQRATTAAGETSQPTGAQPNWEAEAG
jgi:hypothetical protein